VTYLPTCVIFQYGVDGLDLAALDALGRGAAKLIYQKMRLLLAHLLAQVRGRSDHNLSQKKNSSEIVLKTQHQYREMCMHGGRQPSQKAFLVSFTLMEVCPRSKDACDGKKNSFCRV
jgi:hypothetical protein